MWSHLSHNILTQIEAIPLYVECQHSHVYDLVKFCDAVQFVDVTRWDGIFDLWPPLFPEENIVLSTHLVVSSPDGTQEDEILVTSPLLPPPPPLLLSFPIKAPPPYM